MDLKLVREVIVGRLLHSEPSFYPHSEGIMPYFVPQAHIELITMDPTRNTGLFLQHFKTSLARIQLLVTLKASLPSTYEGLLIISSTMLRAQATLHGYERPGMPPTSHLPVKAKHARQHLQRRLV